MSDGRRTDMTALYKCSDCYWIFEESSFDKAPHPFRGETEEIWGCPACGNVDGFTNMCDEPGCDKEAGCGFPTEGGPYRRTCYEHSIFNKEKAHE